MNELLSFNPSNHRDLIDYEEAVPVTDVNLVELDVGTSAVVVFGDADLYAKVQRGDSVIRVNFLDSKEEGLSNSGLEFFEFKEEDVALLGSDGLDLLVPWLRDTDNRRRDQKKILRQVTAWINRGFSLEEFLRENFGG